MISRLQDIPRGPADVDSRGRPRSRVIVDGWTYVGTTPVVRGLVIGIVGAFAAGGVVIGLARTYVSDLGGGDSGYGLLFGTVFAGLGLGMWRGPRLLQGLSRRRLFGISLTLTGLLLFPLALVQQLPVVVGLTARARLLRRRRLDHRQHPARPRGARRGPRPDLRVRRLDDPAGARAGAGRSRRCSPGLIGTHDFGPLDENGDPFLVYNGAAFTFLIAAVLMTAVGVASYRQMDDRKGTSLMTDLKHAFTGSPGVYAATGCFVALEGGEGAGKSTQARLLRDGCEAEGYDVLLTHEPGDTEVGAEAAPDRARPGHRRRSRTAPRRCSTPPTRPSTSTGWSRPALARGAVVVTDRYVDSTLAYQGAGRDLADREVERVARWATADLRPHLTVLLDLRRSRA